MGFEALSSTPDPETTEAGRIRGLMLEGRLTDAVRSVLESLQRGEKDFRLLEVSAEVWVAAVEQKVLDAALSWDNLDELNERLLTTSGGSRPPVFLHRIAAQHSAGIVGHLQRAAKCLSPTLTRMLHASQPALDCVLAGLLLRDYLPTIDQTVLSELHVKHFADFHVDDLRIPYSVVFDNRNFKRNISDLNGYVSSRGVDLFDGRLSLAHVVTLLWLVPVAFAVLPQHWPRAALASRREYLTQGGVELAAARTLMLAFDTSFEPEASPSLAERARELAALRAKLLLEIGAGEARPADRIQRLGWQLIAISSNELASRFPAIRSVKRRPKVAICVSGQLRGYRRVFPTWTRLLANIDATVFVSSWTRVGLGNPEPFRSVLPFAGRNFSRVYKSLGTDLGLERLRERYPCLFAALEDSGEVSLAEVEELYRTPHVRLDDDRAEPYAGLTNSQKMYLKMEQAHDLARRTGQEFDAVVRIRPDKPIRAVGFFWWDLIQALRMRPALYCETALGVHYGALLAGDQVAIGLPQASRIYAETFSRSPAIAAMAPYRMEAQLHGHSSVAQLCWMAGIEIRRVPVKFGPFQEATPLSAMLIAAALKQDSMGRGDAIDATFEQAVRMDLSTGRDGVGRTRAEHEK